MSNGEDPPKNVQRRRSAREGPMKKLKEKAEKVQWRISDRKGPPKKVKWRRSEEGPLEKVRRRRPSRKDLLKNMAHFITNHDSDTIKAHLIQK